MKDAELQRQYYATSAKQYAGKHIADHDSHQLALSALLGFMDLFEIQSVLDVGSGTGRAVTFLKNRKIGCRVIGVEPVRELREIGYANGLLESDLVEGDALNLDWKDAEFDLVCEFGMLHHVRDPGRVIDEMLRVARKGIFISDSNNFGHGSYTSRTTKQVLNFFGVWKIANFIKTRGRGYHLSEGDGLSYSYSVFSNLEKLRRSCREIYFMNVEPSGPNLYRTAPTVALLGIK